MSARSRRLTRWSRRAPSFLSFGLAPLGYLLVSRAVALDAATVIVGAIARQPAWIAGATVRWSGFALTVARGVGPLA